MIDTTGIGVRVKLCTSVNDLIIAWPGLMYAGEAPVIAMYSSFIGI
jgi:hypothetical protein